MSVGLQQLEVRERFRQSPSTGSQFTIAKSTERHPQGHTSAHKEEAWCFRKHNPRPTPSRREMRLKVKRILEIPLALHRAPDGLLLRRAVAWSIRTEGERCVE